MKHAPKHPRSAAATARYTDTQRTIVSSALLLLAALTVGITITSSRSTFAASDTVKHMLSDPNLSVFSNALKSSELWDHVVEEEGLTLFVPTNNAMGAEGSRFLLDNVLLATGNEQRLTDVLSHHIVIGQLNVDPIPSQVQRIATMRGSCIDIQSLNGSLALGSGASITGRLQNSKVTVYIIDQLLIQPWNDERVCGNGT